MCRSRSAAAPELNAVSRGVVSACCLRCLDRSAVDTGAEFASPSGAPLGYDCYNSFKLCQWQLLDRPAAAERAAARLQMGASAGPRVCACAVAACEGPSVRASCMPCAWRMTLTVGASDAHAHRRVECCAARCARWS